MCERKRSNSSVVKFVINVSNRRGLLRGEFVTESGRDEHGRDGYSV